MSEVRMPKMGDGMIEGTVLRWLKHEGDQVAPNETIAEIETDKANVEMPAEDGGTLSKIVVKEGETVPVGAVIAYIVLADRVGFLIIGPLVLFALFIAYGVRPLTAIAVAIIVAFVIHYAFYKLLRVPLPWGVLTPFAF